MRLSELSEIDQSLRPYQITGKKEIYRAWDTCRTVLFQMPTGTGKTRLFSSIIKDIRRLWAEDKILRKVLVLAHRKELIKQIDETLSEKYGISHGIIKSGVDETWNRDVQVASVQTIVYRLDKWSAKDFAFIIIDEAHHAVASTYIKICNQFPEAKILGVTATPCRLTGDALRKIFGVLIVSQPINKFIEQHYLSEYTYYSIKPDSPVQMNLDNISHFNIEGDYAEADMMRVMDDNKVRANIVDAYKKFALGKKGIIYTINQTHNKHICEAFEKIGVKIKAIDSKTPEKERDTIVAQFRSGKIDIICNVNIFSEGFDCPDIEFIQLARPTCSLAMYLQQVGRGLRPHPEGIPATILDNVGSYNKFGLPSANRHWYRHFEGQGQRVTHSSMGSRFGTKTVLTIGEGDEDMMLIFNGVTTVSEKASDISILDSIKDTKVWFPFGSTALLDPYSGMLNVRKYTQAACYYAEYEDLQEWLDTVEDEIESARDDIDNENKQDEIEWVDEKIHRIFKFTHEGKYGLCQLNESPSQLADGIERCKAGKIRIEDVFTMLLPPIYDEIGIPDDQGRSICVKDGKYGVLSSESYLPIVSFQYEALEFQPNGLYLAMKDGKVGLIKGDQPVIPFENEEIVDISADIDKQYYLIHDEDHYRLLLFKQDKQINQQKKLSIYQHLFGDLYLGLSLCNHGFICNSEGEILYPLRFDRIGVTRTRGVISFVLGIRSAALILDENLSEISDVIQSKLSHDDFIDQFQIETLYVVNGKTIKERGKKKQQETKVQTKTETPEEIGIQETSIVADATPKPSSPCGVFLNDEGLFGFAIEGKNVLEPVYEQIETYGKDRLIVRKDGKYGLIAIENGIARPITPLIFKRLAGARNNQYVISMYKKYSERHTEEYLKSVLCQTEEHLVLKENGGNVQIRFMSGLVAEYNEVIHIGDEVFIAKDAKGKYGIIRCKQSSVMIIRPFEYSKISLSEDNRNVLLYTTGRPRFIPLPSLLNKKQ